MIFNPWLSITIWGSRLICFFLIALKFFNSARSSWSEVLFLISFIIAGDIFDGYLIRRYSPKYASVFRVFDSLLDKIGVVSILVIMMLYKGMPGYILFIVAVRETILLTAYPLFLSYFKMRHFDSRLWGKVFYIVIALLVAAVLLELPVSYFRVSFFLIFIALISIVDYALLMHNLLISNGRTQ